MPPDASTTPHERERLALLSCTRLLDSGANEAFDRITRLAASLFDVPISLISLVDERRQWFKSRIGLDVRETDRGTSFCSHAIERRDVMVLEDVRTDPRFVDNPMVTGEPFMRFYAGAPLLLPSGHALGTLCILDSRPRTFGAADCATLADLAALVMAQVELHQLAGHIDSVTRLPNRAQMGEDLDALCTAFPGERRSLMLLDVMRHSQLQAAVRAVGIRPLEGSLRQIAAKLRSLLPADAALYHVSETRFSFLLPGDSVEAHDAAAARVLARMREPFTSGGITVALEARAGLVDFALERSETADVLRKATSAMHESKAKRQGYLWHGTCFDAAHRRAWGLLRDVSPGLLRGEFRLVYQPKLNLHTGSYAGVEALARWTHPEFGNVSPGEFIPLIEATTLIHELTPWVLDQALAQQRRWRDAGIDLTIAINVSSHNLEHPGFLRMVADACHRHDVPTHRVHIECTEHSVLTGPTTQATLEALREMGAQVSLDDFGMGFSNLACLTSLPVQLLKIDQSLVMPIAGDTRALQLVTSLIQMGHALGYRMLAEGVETREVYDLLVNAGCDAMQGYFLSRPLEADALAEFMRRHRAAPAVSPNRADAGTPIPTT